MVKESNCKELSDNQLVVYSLANMEYFMCLYERYERRLLRYIGNISSLSNEQAQDILQDAFVKIWQNLRGFDTSMKLSSWIYRIVRNETISYWRKNKSYLSHQKVISETTPSKEDPEELLVFEDIYIRKEKINALLREMPLRYRSVLILKFKEGMSYQEISDILKIPRGTVATRLNRAKKKFSKLAKDHSITF